MNIQNLYSLPITNLELIKHLIPHREPIIMIDGLLSYHEGRIVAQFKILSTNIFVENRCFSETGMIEHMAQTVALYGGYGALSNKLKPLDGYIGAINEINIIRCPEIGETIVTEGEILYQALGMTKVQLISKIDDVQIAIAEMTTVVRSNEI